MIIIILIMIITLTDLVNWTQIQGMQNEFNVVPVLASFKQQAWLQFQRSASVPTINASLFFLFLFPVLSDELLCRGPPR